MKKLAIFVEGRTEQIFVHKLIEQIASTKNLTVRMDSVRGGTTIQKKIENATIYNAEEEAKYFVLIRDCGSDSKVLAEAKEQYESLKNSQYDRILGLRDLHPLENDKLNDVLSAIEKIKSMFVSDDELSVDIIVVVREIEAWFLAEHSHFSRLHEDITYKLIEQTLNLDVKELPAEDYEHPSETLHQIYKLVDLAYKKKTNQLHRTVDVLCYETFYLELVTKIKELKYLIDHIDEFLTLDNMDEAPQG